MPRPVPATPSEPAPRADRPAPDLRRVALGRHGEVLARRHLEQAGLVVLDANWRGPSGELDLVAREDDVLVVVEVKTRATVLRGTPHEAVTPAKLARLLRLAEEWQQAHGVRAPEVRVDLVAVLRPRRGPSALEHVRGLV